MTIHERIKIRRKECGLSADEVAAELGVSRATVYRYESAEIENMGIDKIEPLARVLRTTPEYLMGWSGDPNDWEQIAADTGIFPPRDFEGDPIEYIKYKVMEEQDEITDDYYNTLQQAETYLRDNGCKIFDDGLVNILVVLPTGERFSVAMGNLVRTFQLYGTISPEIRGFVEQCMERNYTITPQKITISDNPDIRMIARAGKKMTPEQAENLRKYAEYMFPEAFKNDP